jgi:hypothetical protein
MVDSRLLKPLSIPSVSLAKPLAIQTRIGSGAYRVGVVLGVTLRLLLEFIYTKPPPNSTIETAVRQALCRSQVRKKEEC